MDGYPDHLAPEFEDGGAVLTPVAEWWDRVRGYFPYVPDNVAQYWLHEHWSHSPYAFLRSNDYSFDHIEWRANDLNQIRSGFCDFDAQHKACRETGEYLIGKLSTKSPHRTAAYMARNREFPAPIIVLDNCNDHLRRDHPTQHLADYYPIGYVLIEGHTRFNIALHLQQIGGGQAQLAGLADDTCLTMCFRSAG